MFADHVALLIGVVSCGVLLAVAGLALARARRARSHRPPRPHRPARAHAAHSAHSAHAAAAAADAEMAWDDTALTITVNPMDEVTNTTPFI